MTHIEQIEQKVQSIGRMFNARSVAIVGASGDPRKFGYMTLNSIINGGYEGKIYPINPKGGEFMGLKVYPSLKEVPGKLDLAVIIVPAEFVPGVMSEAAEKGVEGVAILSGGFREAGRPDLEKEIAAISQKRNIRIMGPNIQGINYLPNKLCAMFFPVIKTKGPLAIISQSGTFTAALSEWAADEGLGISAAVNLGNQVDLCESDYIEFFAVDKNTKAIVLYLEGVKDGQRFLEVIRRAACQKSICILKGGRTTAGQKSAASHTGSLAGKHEVFAAACRQFGVFVTHDLETLYDGAKAVSTLCPLKGNRVMVMSTSGGIGVLASDEIEGSSLTLPSLSKELINELKKSDMPPLAVLSNPLDMVSIQAEYFERAVLVADRMDAADVFLLGFGDPVTGGAEMVKKLASKINGKLTVAYLGGGNEEKIGRVELQKAGIPVFPSSERAIKGVSAAVKASSFMAKVHHGTESWKTPLREEPIYKKGDVPPRFVLEPEAVKYLQKVGIPYPEHGLASSASEAAKIADSMGYPVVLKVVSPDVLHKSDVEGVTVGLVSPEEVSQGYKNLVDRVEENAPGAKITGVLVCRQADEGLEVIIGALIDAVFGPTVMFGLGGIYAEVYKDVTFRIAPLERSDAEEMVREIKGYPLLTGMRGRSGYDVERLIELLLSVSSLIMDRPEIQELDLNPVRLFERGALALDVRIFEKRAKSS